MNETVWMMVATAALGLVGALIGAFKLRGRAIALQRQWRAEALALPRATPAAAVPAAGGRSRDAVPAADPRAPGLTDNERVAAMRSLLELGDQRGVRSTEFDIATEPMAFRAEPQAGRRAHPPARPPTHAPAHPPTHAPAHAPADARGAPADADHEHISLF